ncbi:MAG TPA: replication protein RepA [Candidatus Competibacteraceae bacterium]|nr:replication protein RepA [Candidatus Competibacteraceae bacterium]
MSTLEDALKKLKAREQQVREKARAEGRRPLSAVKRRLIDSSVKVAATLPEEILFQHSVFCQTVLPYRDPGPEVRIWEREQGQVSLSLEAGRAKDPQGQYVPVGLPYGSAARLMLCHLNTTALQTGTRAVEIDSSMTAFFRRLQGRDCNSRDIQRFKKQLIRLASCIIRFGFDTGPRTVQVDTKIITAFDIGEEYFDGERFLFPQVIQLSADYFESLQTHAVPLDERALASLAHTAMGLDVYTWLAQRLHRVDPQRGQFIPWTALHEQFGQGYKDIRFFRRVFLNVLEMVKLQYPQARVKADKGGLLLGHSPPPVPSRHLILLSKPTLPKD